LLNDSFFEAQRISYDLKRVILSDRERQTRRDYRRDQSHSSTAVFDDDLDEEEEEVDVPLQPNYSPKY
jgi:hypothetical protein